MTELSEQTGSAFRQLKVWQRSMDIAESAYKIAADLPKEEQFALANQIRRCSTSIPSNIAEGSKRGGKDFARFLRVANGSAAELETHLVLVERMYNLSTTKLIEELTITQKMLESLLKKV